MEIWIVLDDRTGEVRGGRLTVPGVCAIDSRATQTNVIRSMSNYSVIMLNGALKKN
jgi:hypothetical protein